MSNKIFSAKDEILIDGGVAIKGNKILKIGSKETLKKYIDTKTEVYEYKDKLVMPGFIDSHTHVILGSLYNHCVNLGEAKSEEEASKMVKDFADSNPEDPWVLGFNWYHIFWENKTLPSKKSLDKLLPDRPVFLLNAEAHGAWANSKALDLCGIDKNTKDPESGQIGRDSNGEPNGLFFENALGLISKYAYDLPEKKQKELLESFSKKAIRYGVTSVVDMQPYFGSDLGNKRAYQEFIQQDKESIRINVVLGLNENNIKAFEEIKEEWKEIDKLDIVALKEFIDGVHTTYTALLLEPYSDKENFYGNPLINLEKLKKMIQKAHSKGINIRLHACGDGAVRFALESYKDVIKKYGYKNTRHTIEHIENIHEDDIPLFAKYNIIASMQPEHIAITEKFLDNPYPIRVGKKRERYLWPIKSILKSGATVSLGSDYPVVDINPFLEIYRGVTRLHNDRQPEGGWNPEEKLKIGEALRAYTYGSAYALQKEDKLGTLEEGKLADIIVLDKNLFEISPDEILKTNVIYTMINGEVLFREE